MNILALLQDRAYGWLALVILSGYIAWFVLFKLSLQIAGIKMRPAIHFAILIMVAYALGARPFISIIPFIFLMWILMVFLLCTLGRFSFFKASFAACITFFISYLGNIFIYYSILAFNPEFVSFLNSSVAGYLIGTGIETIFPLLVLILFPNFSIPPALWE